MKYSVQLIKSEEGFAIGCLELPGCWSQGKTREEALANIREAIRTYLGTKRDLALRDADEVTEVEVAI